MTVAAITAAVLLVRMAPVFLRGAFLDEEQAAAGHVAWHGFIHVLPWIVLQTTPAIAQLTLLATIVVVATWLASDRLDFPIYAGVALALLPFSSSQVYSTVLDAHWFMAIGLAALAIAEPATTPTGRIRDGAVAAFVSLNGPWGLVLLPLAWRRPWLAAPMLAGGLIQLVVLLTSERTPGLDPALVALAAGRITIAPLGDGLVPPLWAWPIAGALLTACVWRARDLVGVMFPALAYVAIATGLLAAQASTFDRLATGGEARYFIAAAWLALVLAGRSRVLLVVAAVALLAGWYAA